MAEGHNQAPVDFVSLASYLSALAYPVRLELVSKLRFPHPLSDMRVLALRGSGGGPEHAASRETIRAHLDKLVDADLVRVDQDQEEGRTVNIYVANLQKLYALTEELRRMTTLYAGPAGVGDATSTLVPATHAAKVAGPRLVLVHGVYEGKAFPLTAATSHEGRWVLGRRRGVAVSLDYDPFVSLDNAEVTQDRGRYLLTDLPGSKNGTLVNWTRLPRGGTQELRATDIIGVGRSLLAFAPA